MALQYNYTRSNTRQDFTTAYIRVDDVRVVDKRRESGKVARIHISVYATEAAATTDDNNQRGLPIGEEHIEIDYDLTSTDNILVWAYNQLKALPEFSGAVDI